MNKTVSDETLRFLIAQKMSYVSSTVNVCMLWWVSSIAFCGYVFAGVWSNQNRLGQPVYVMVLGMVFFVFFFFIAYFAYMVAYRLVIVQKEMAYLANLLNYDQLLELNPKGGFFYTEMVTFKKSMIIGSLSFALIFIVWSGSWIFLSFKLWYVYGIVSSLLTILWIVLWLRSHRRTLPQLGEWVKVITQPEEG